MYNPFKKTYGTAELRQFKFLSKVKFFEQLRYSEMIRFLPAIHKRKFQKDEVVFFRKDPSQALYILEKGKIKLTIDIKGQFETILELHAGSPFGENSLLKDCNRIYTSIVDSEEADIWVIPHYAIQEIFENNPKIQAKMLNSLAEFYNDNNARLFASYQSSYGFFNLGQMFQ